MIKDEAFKLSWLISCIYLGLSGCALSQTVSPKDISIIKVSDTIIIGASKVLDGQGKLFEWTGKGDCSQTEGMPPMFKLRAGASLRNLQMKNAPDGIHIAGSNVTLDNIVNLDVCEDAVSIKLDKNKRTPQNVTISNSKFFDCEDKAIQITRGNNILIQGNEFHRCAKAVRIKEQASNIRFENNKVYDAKIAVKVTGGSGSAAGNLINGAKVAFWAEKGGHFTIDNSNQVKAASEIIRETERGRITVKRP